MQKKTAQSIAESASEIIGYGVLVTDENGIIIGCGNTKRVGTLHSPSLDVMSLKRPIPTSKDEAASMVGVKSGYTFPIKIMDSVVGTISISGPPEKVERYGLLVQKQAEIMLKEQSIFEMKLRKEQAVKDLAQSIMIYDPVEENEANLLLHGKELGFELERCRIAAILEVDSFSNEQGETQSTTLKRVMNFFSNPAHLISPLSNFQFVFFLALRCSQRNGEMEAVAAALCRSLRELLEKEGTNVSVGIGLQAKNLLELSASAHSAKEALRIGKVISGPGIHPARFWGMERLMASISRRRRAQHVKTTLSGLEKADSKGDLRKTFLEWCKSPFAPQDVAERLSIHRNTLQYRLKKIKEVLGLDPWCFHDSFALWTAVTLEEFERNETFLHDRVARGCELN
ncbi:CdaR family transcriptional regulator [Synergistales bacterium]|nr:CdaR family transcriptional regulator [Synergistales bacterium]